MPDFSREEFIPEQESFMSRGPEASTPNRYQSTSVQPTSKSNSVLGSILPYAGVYIFFVACMSLFAGFSNSTRHLCTTPFGGVPINDTILGEKGNIVVWLQINGIYNFIFVGILLMCLPMMRKQWDSCTKEHGLWIVLDFAKQPMLSFVVVFCNLAAIGDLVLAIIGMTRVFQEDIPAKCFSNNMGDNTALVIMEIIAYTSIVFYSATAIFFISSVVSSTNISVGEKLSERV